MSRKIYKSGSLFFALFFAVITACLPVYSAVYTAPYDYGEADTVYVAGNPNAYPLEYYSEEDKAFCGVFPDILKAVSEKTNISFTYISASDKNRQKELCRAYRRGKGFIEPQGQRTAGACEGSARLSQVI